MYEVRYVYPGQLSGIRPLPKLSSALRLAGFVDISQVSASYPYTSLGSYIILSLGLEVLVIG